MSFDALAGEPFGKYVLVKRIAMGGMAEVCLARLQGTAGFNKLVVIKQVLPAFAESEQFVEMFLDEGRLAAKLSHPNIAQTFELGEENGRHYLAMEFVPGESLYAVLKRCREQHLLLPMGCVLRVAMQLLEALEYAHSLIDETGQPMHLVHRDITPSNVMVTQQGAVKLLDFGIARAATQLHRTEVGRVKGKGGYMAPEQCRTSNVDHRADIYGAGAVLYLMATGLKPFEHLSHGGDLLVQMNATMEGNFLPPRQVKKELDPELERIILKAMALKPDERYQTAGDMLEDLERFAAKTGIFPSPRELGDLVKKLFPPKLEDAIEQTREQSSSRATPAPVRDEKLATSDFSAAEGERVAERSSGGRKRPSGRLPVATPSGGRAAARVVAPVEAAPDEPLTSPNPVVRRLPMPLLAVSVAGLALLSLGIALAFKFTRPRVESSIEALPRVLEVQPEPQAAAVVDDAPGEAAAPEVDGEGEETSAPKGGAPKAVVKKKKDGAVAAVAVRPTGTLMINAYPWAKVSLRGKELGVTPLKISLPAGEYPLELENPAVNIRRSIKLTVREGTETSHFEKMQ
ncbi:MAG: protein kinase [Archangiaceae bacterium]|nr:protein kinase [Archangiaceae bacterium]